MWIDTSSGLHNGGCTFSFGHAEIKRWSEGRTSYPVKYSTLNRIAVPQSRDFEWLAERTPRK